MVVEEFDAVEPPPIPDAPDEDQIGEIAASDEELIAEGGSAEDLPTLTGDPIEEIKKEEAAE